MATPSYASEPQVQYLHQLLEQIGSAELLIPDFQRPARWKDEQRKRLLESVSAGYPIGSVMAWRTSVKIPHRRKIGPHALVEPDASGMRQYLLDGFQRMSTLYAALRAPRLDRVGPDEEGHRWALGYHLLEEEWVFLDEVDEQEEGVVLPGYLVLESVPLMRFQRKLDHPQLDLMLGRSDAIVRSIREYKLPVIPMVTDSIDEATRTFGLLNTEGTRMSDLDLVVALTWQTDYDLREQLDEAKAALSQIGWEGLDEKYILSVLRAAFDLDIYDSKSKALGGSIKQLGDKLRDDPTMLHRAIEGLVSAGRFLAERCGVVSLNLLPYSYQGVVLADVFRRHPQPTAELESSLERWFWWTTAWTTFAGISGYRMTAMLTYLRNLAEGREPDWPWRLGGLEPAVLPSTSDPRSALVRAVTLELFACQERDDALRRRLEGQGAGALTRGLSGLPSRSARDLGNAFLVSIEDEPSLKSALQSRSRGESSVLDDDSDTRARHLIDDQAWGLLGRCDGVGFVARRHDALESHHRRLLSGMGLPPGVGVR